MKCSDYLRAFMTRSLRAEPQKCITNHPFFCSLEVETKQNKIMQPHDFHTCREISLEKRKKSHFILRRTPPPKTKKQFLAASPSFFSVWLAIRLMGKYVKSDAFCIPTRKSSFPGFCSWWVGGWTGRKVQRVVNNSLHVT